MICKASISRFVVIRRGLVVAKFIHIIQCYFFHMLFVDMLYVEICKVVGTWCPFYKYSLTLIPARISNYIHFKVWDEITHPFLNFNGCTVGF